mgnify:CR=1 FL=1
MTQYRRQVTMVVFRNINMPIYVYQCNACGERMDKLQKISDPVLLDCPLCGQAALQKMVTAAGFRLKGSGWYETDFKTEGKRNLAGDHDAAEKSPEAADKTAASADKGDSKKAAKADADSGSKPAKPGNDSNSKAKPKADKQAST